VLKALHPPPLICTRHARLGVSAARRSAKGSVGALELVEKLHADTHEFAPFKPLLLGLLRVAAKFGKIL
jgi:hypothetical protein